VVLILERKLRLPSTWSCLLVLFVFAGLFTGFMWLIIPLISEQIDTFQQINFSEMSKDLSAILSRIQDNFWKYGLMSREQTLEQSMTEGLQVLVSSIHFEAIFSNLVSVLSNLFIGIFSVVFVSFFFLKDESLF
jgi:predicted PurR-regulated permease PerM